MASTTMATPGSLETNSTGADLMAPHSPLDRELTPGERLVQSTSFRFSLTHFFVSSRLLFTSKRLVVNRPSMLFRLIPMGSEKLSHSLLTMASVGMRTSIQVTQLILGVLAMAAAAASVHETYAWPILFIGAFLTLDAFRAVFRVVNNDGTAMDVRTTIFDQAKARAFADRINAALPRESVPGPRNERNDDAVSSGIENTDTKR